jgi:hypothetical protein
MSKAKTKSTKPKAAKAVKPAKVKAVKAEAPAKVAHEQRNGVTQPGAGTACRAIWDALDALKAQDKEITFDVLRAAVDSKVADATVRTQRQRWKTFNA